MLQLKLALFKLSVEVTFISSRFLRHPAWETKKDLKHVRSTELNAWPELGYRVTSAISLHNKGLDYVCNESWMWPMSMVCPKNDSTFNSFPQCTGSHAADQTDVRLLILFFKIIMSHILAWHVREVMSAVQSDRGDARSIIIYDSWWETNLFLFLERQTKTHLF